MEPNPQRPLQYSIREVQRLIERQRAEIARKRGGNERVHQLTISA
jgi:hypothetical protein